MINPNPSDNVDPLKTQPSLRWRVASNTAAQLINQLFSIMIGLVINALISRHLGVEGYGKYNYVSAFYLFFLSLNDFGTHTITIREVSKNPQRANEIIGSMLSFKLLLSGVILLVSFLIISFKNPAADLKSALWIYGLYLPILALQLPLIMFQIRLKMEQLTILGILNRLLQFALILFSLLMNATLPWIVAAVVAADLLFIPIYWYAARNLVAPKLNLDTRIWKPILGSSVILGATGIVGYFTNQVNFIFVQHLSSTEDLGLFSAAYRIVSLFQLIPPLLMNTIYPIMARYSVESIPNLKRLYYRCLGLFCLAGVGLGFLVTLTAPLAVRLIFGASFAGAVPGVQVLIWAIVFIFFGICGGNILITFDRQIKTFWILAISGICNIALNFILIPRFGYIGTCWASVVSLAIISTLTLIAVEQTFRQKLSSAKPSQKTGVFIDNADGRPTHIKKALQKKGLEITAFEVSSWGIVISQTPRFIAELTKASFVISSMNVPYIIPWIVLAKGMQKKLFLDYPVDLTVKPFATAKHWEALVHWTLGLADYVVILKSRSYLIAKLKINPRKFIYLENCPPSETIAQAQNISVPNPFPKNALRFCYSGVASWQHAEIFVPVFKEIKAAVPNVHWLVISLLEDSYAQNLKNSVRSHGVEASTTFVPVIKPYETFIATVNQCDLWISHMGQDTLLAQTELRTELLEIGLLGKAVVAVDTPALRIHGFEDGKNIILIDPANPAASREKIMPYLLDAEKRARLGENLRQHILTHFSLDQYIERMVETIITSIKER